jgi:hypothetical protein
MSNGDMPAAPAGKISIKCPKGGDPFGNYTKTANGLTKREYFAGMAMQAMITKFGHSCDMNCKQAIEIADELLKELEE